MGQEGRGVCVAGGGGGLTLLRGLLFSVQLTCIVIAVQVHLYNSRFAGIITIL